MRLFHPVGFVRLELLRAGQLLQVPDIIRKANAGRGDRTLRIRVELIQLIDQLFVAPAIDDHAIVVEVDHGFSGASGCRKADQGQLMHIKQRIEDPLPLLEQIGFLFRRGHVGDVLQFRRRGIVLRHSLLCAVRLETAAQHIVLLEQLPDGLCHPFLIVLGTDDLRIAPGGTATQLRVRLPADVVGSLQIRHGAGLEPACRIYGKVCIPTAGDDIVPAFLHLPSQPGNSALGKHHVKGNVHLKHLFHPAFQFSHQNGLSPKLNEGGVIIECVRQMQHLRKKFMDLLCKL